MHYKNVYPHCIDVLCCGQSERIHLAGCGHASSTREHWQTDQMMSAYLSLVTSCFSSPDKLILTLNFMVVGSIFTGIGVTHHLEQGAQLPLSSVSKQEEM